MGHNVESEWSAQPGDILLLSSNGKGRRINLIYQKIVLGGSVSHTHVALVISPFRVIHAMLGKGIEVVPWREIRDNYDVHNSKVARLRDLDECQRDLLIDRARYYYGQPYSLRALINPTETYRDKEGIVCSQFVAQVFHDVQRPCTSAGPRKCLPADIDRYISEDPNWSFINLTNYLFDVPPKNEIFHDTNDTLYLLDGYVADSLAQNFFASQMTQAIEGAFESMAKLAQAGNICAEDLQWSRDEARDALTSVHLEAAWRRHFAAPKSAAAFMHEEGPACNKMKDLFIESCSHLGAVATEAGAVMSSIKADCEHWATQATEEFFELHPHDAVISMRALSQRLLDKSMYLDDILGWVEGSSCELEINVSGLLAAGVYSNQEDLLVAKECLLIISEFVSARIWWHSLRSIIMDKISV